MHATHDVLIYIYTISIIGFTFIIRSSGIPVYSSQLARSGIPVYSDSTDIALFAHSDGHSSIPRFSYRITKKTCIDIFMYTSI